MSVAVRSLAGAEGGSVLGVALRVCAVNLGLRSDGAPIRALQKLFGGRYSPRSLGLPSLLGEESARVRGDAQRVSSGGRLA
ncbi:hypothetical protein MRX96_021738 [Rhipicephalus microplus]